MKTINQLKASVASVTKAHGKQREAIQAVLIDLTEHAFKFSDVSLFWVLANGLRGADVKALIAWSESYAPVKFGKEGISYNKAKGKTGFFDQAYLEAQPKWYEFSRALKDTVKTVDPIEMLASLVAQCKEAIRSPIKATDDVKPDGSPKVVTTTVVHPESVSVMETLLLKLRSEIVPA